MELENRNTVWLWRSDEDNWERFGAEHNDQIESALESGNQDVVLERHDTTYFLDLSRLTQTNGCTGRMRWILPLTAGSTWLLERAKGLQPFFSEEDTEEIEKAFFEGKECFVLQRCTRTYYVDLKKLTITDLTSGKERNIKVSNDRVSFLSACVSSKREASTAYESDETECTESSVSEYTFGSGGAYVAQKHGRRSSRASWRWENDSDSWSAFDENIAAAIEHSWEAGAPEMIFERGSSFYFVDLQSLTQVNVCTGFARAIQRLELEEDS